MHSYFEPVARGVCWVMAAILLSQAATLLLRKNPSASLEVPQTFVALKASSEGSVSNSSQALPQGPGKTHTGTNSPTRTNSTSSTVHNSKPSAAAMELKATNAVVQKAAATSAPVIVSKGMPATQPKPMTGLPGMPPAMGGPMGRGQPATLPPSAQAWVDQVKDTEVFGPVPRPMPMALLGIAGEDVFFRAPNGQTGVIRKGGELGGVKLLQTGPNRILVEHEGQKKELTIFSGIGGETLMPADTNKSQQVQQPTRL